MGFSTEFVGSEPSRAEIDGQPGPLVIEFGAPWCGYCLAARPLVEEAFSAFPEVRHIKVEDGRGRPLGRSFRVKLWPTLVFLRDGREIARVVRPEGSAAIASALSEIVRPEH